MLQTKWHSGEPFPKWKEFKSLKQKALRLYRNTGLEPLGLVCGFTAVLPTRRPGAMEAD
jgi:hypothetical protein